LHKYFETANFGPSKQRARRIFQNCDPAVGTEKVFGAGGSERNKRPFRAAAGRFSFGRRDDF
jgi:hypothetical protein